MRTKKPTKKEVFQAFLESKGLKQDAYGHYKFTINHPQVGNRTYRIKMQETSFRLEKKLDSLGEWVNVKNKPNYYKDIVTEGELPKIILDINLLLQYRV